MSKQTLESFGLLVSGIESTHKEVEREIPNPEKRKPGRYPQPGWTKTIKVKETVPDSFSSHVKIEGSPSDFASLWSMAKERPEVLAKNPENLAALKRLPQGERDKFCGGSSEKLSDDLAGRADMTEALIAKEQVESNQAMERIRSELAAMFPKRRRVFGDEGQWVESRRWDGDAFEDFKRGPNPTPAINIRLLSAENAGVSASKIARFGALGWAIADTLESYGVRVGLEVVYECLGSFDGLKKLETVCRIKEPGEYLSPSFAMGVLTPNFFRRVEFATIVSVSDACGKEVSPGFGHAPAEGYPAKYADGTLTLSSYATRSLDTVADEILEALKQLTA